MTTVVGILGISHDPDIRARCHFPLTLVARLIDGSQPDVILGEVEPRSWRLYCETGNPHGILQEVQDEYPDLIYPYCERNGVTFWPVDWFLEDLFQDGPLDRFEPPERAHLEQEWAAWQERQLATAALDPLPLNSDRYDQVTNQMYDWLYTLNPEVQTIQWVVRHQVMMARVRKAIKAHPGKRLLAIHGADHTYWYRRCLSRWDDVSVEFPLAR